MRRYTGSLYRNPQKGRIAGVCAGVAEAFGVETWLVRILAVTGFFLLAGPFMVVVYIAAWFIMDKKPQATRYSENDSSIVFQNGERWSRAAAESTVELKTKVWQAGEPAKQVFSDVQQKFVAAERRLRSLESYVTSREFQLKREINNL